MSHEDYLKANRITVYKPSPPQPLPPLRPYWEYEAGTHAPIGHYSGKELVDRLDASIRCLAEACDQVIGAGKYYTPIEQQPLNDLRPGIGSEAFYMTLDRGWCWAMSPEEQRFVLVNPEDSPLPKASTFKVCLSRKMIYPELQHLKNQALVKRLRRRFPEHGYSYPICLNLDALPAFDEKKWFKLWQEVGILLIDKTPVQAVVTADPQPVTKQTIKRKKWLLPVTLHPNSRTFGRGSNITSRCYQKTRPRRSRPPMSR